MIFFIIVLLILFIYRMVKIMDRIRKIESEIKRLFEETQYNEISKKYRIDTETNDVVLNVVL